MSRKVEDIRKTHLLDLEEQEKDFEFYLTQEELRKIIKNFYNFILAFIEDFEEVNVIGVKMIKKAHGKYVVKSYDYIGKNKQRKDEK